MIMTQKHISFVMADNTKVFFQVVPNFKQSSVKLLPKILKIEQHNAK